MPHSRLLTLLLFAVLLMGTSGTPAAAANIPPAGGEEPPASETVPAVSLAAGVDIPFSCAYDPEHAVLVESLTAQNWRDWIARLSGVESVMVNSLPVFITTRYSLSLFNGASPAYDYVKDTVSGWYPGQIEEDPYLYGSYQWKNLVLTLPGSSPSGYTVLLTAHLDSMPSYGSAPGADDNATGAAALLEVARLLQGSTFPNTIRLIWFTGEEQGLRGSYAYALDHDLSQVAGVINLDMYGYDSNNDHCFEIHAGTLAQSNRVGGCLTQAIGAYQIDLTYDYLTTTATNRSDHASFWPYQTGAVLLLENFFFNDLPGGCVGSDANPSYHTSGDTLDKINLTTGESITRAALAALLGMADPYLPNQFFFSLVAREEGAD